MNAVPGLAAGSKDCKYLGDATHIAAIPYWIAFLVRLSPRRIIISGTWAKIKGIEAGSRTDEEVYFDKWHNWLTSSRNKTKDAALRVLKEARGELSNSEVVYTFHPSYPRYSI